MSNTSAGVPVLRYWDKVAPLEVVAAATMAGLEVRLESDPMAAKDYVMNLALPDGEVVQSRALILKYIARVAAANGKRLYGLTPLDACRVDEWIAYTEAHFVSGAALPATAAACSRALALHTFMAGHAVSIADLCAWGALRAAPMWPKVRREPLATTLARWYDHIAAQPAVAAVLSADSAAAARSVPPIPAGSAPPAVAGSTRGTKAGDTGSFDIGLPDARQGAVVTRFPPEPSGYLHIGHAKAALLNQYFADMYGGRLLVRFDDTNPAKESTEFVDNIVDDMRRLGLRYARLSYTSDHFEGMIEAARALIRAGHLYADDTDVETMREQRMAKVPSVRRAMAPAEAERIFEEMLQGSPEGTKHCLRVKMDMSADNACLRDPVVYRCSAHAHWRTGARYKAYPTYDYACPYADAADGVTHALRTSEYRDREEQYQRLLRLLRGVRPDLPGVHIWDYSRLNFVHTVLSKRKLQKLVDGGVVTGWTDPRFPTVQGILRRGMTLPALREFILLQGASRNTTLQEWDKIWAINKKMIDPVAPRHTAVVKEGAVRVTLAGGPAAVECRTVAKHKKNPGAGKKTLYLAATVLIDQADAAIIRDGEEVTLMDWGNCVMERVDRSGSGGAVVSIAARLHLEGDFKKTRLKLTWLADVPELVPLRLVEFGDLITKAKLEEDDDFEAHVNKDSWRETAALGDANMRALQAGDIIQLERKGYYRVDEAMTRADRPPLLFNIPDGKPRKS